MELHESFFALGVALKVKGCQHISCYEIHSIYFKL